MCRQLAVLRALLAALMRTSTLIVTVLRTISARCLPLLQSYCNMLIPVMPSVSFMWVLIIEERCFVLLLPSCYRGDN